MSGDHRKYMDFAKGLIGKNSLSGNKQNAQQHSKQYNRDWNTSKTNASPATSESKFLRPIDEGRYNNSHESRDNNQWPEFKTKIGSRIATPPPPSPPILFSDTKDLCNDSRESRDNNQWPELTTKFGNTDFEMPKDAPNLMAAPPPPTNIDWNDVICRLSTDPISKKNKDRYEPFGNNNQPIRIDDNFSHNFIQNSSSSDTDNEYEIPMDKQHRNIRALQQNKPSEGFWTSEADKRHCDSRKVGIPIRMEEFGKSETDFQNIVQSNFENSQGFLDVNRNSSEKSIHQDFQYIRSFSNTNNLEFRSEGVFGGFETANDNSRGNENMINTGWKPFASGDFQENNISIGTYFDQPQHPQRRTRANDMDFNVTNKSFLNSSTLDEEKVEVRVLNNAKVHCVSMTTKQYERYKKALGFGFSSSEALDFSANGLKKIGLVPTNLKENPLSHPQMQQLESTIIHYAAKWSFNTNLTSCYPQDGWLIILCDNEIADMVQSHLTVIRNICRLDIHLVLEGEDPFPPGHIVHGYFPRSSNYSNVKVMELIQAQNAITTTLWRALDRKVEQGLVLKINFEVDDDSWRKLQELNGSIFYRFGQITLALEESDSTENKNRNQQLPTATAYTSNCKDIAKPNEYNKPVIEQPIQNARLIKLNQLKKDIEINMKLLQHKRTLEENDRDKDKHSNRICQLATVTTDTSNPNPSEFSQPSVYKKSKTSLENPQHIQNVKLNQLKNNIAPKMKILECNRNANLEVVPQSSLPLRHAVSVWIPPPVLSTDKIVKLLGKQNNGFNTQVWKLLSTAAIDTSSGMVFQFAIDTESLEKLKDCRGKLQFGLGTVRFRHPSICKQK